MKRILIITVLFFAVHFAHAQESSTDKVWVFKQVPIEFNSDNNSEKLSGDYKIDESGRLVMRTINFPQTDNARNITGYVTVYPVPKDNLTVYDPWDRAGNIRLVLDGQTDIELIKFITAYGGETSYEVDLTEFDYLFKGDATFKGMIDTWMSPGWKIDFSLEMTPVDSSADLSKHAPEWVHSLIYIPSYVNSYETMDGYEVNVEIPKGMQKVFLNYYASGHCTDGRDDDEFISKDNVIYVDDTPVYRFQPWRDDCMQFRDINPYTKRWSDGYWSSDYGRSGWCPGDMVDPLVLDLSDHLKPGKHSIRFKIENIRPKDENGHFGYWRISSYLTGWGTKDVYKYNEE